MIDGRLRFMFMVLGLVVVLGFGAPVTAQSDEKDDDEKDPAYSERVVVTGSRAQPRSVTESMVPIDVLPAEEFVNQGETDLGTLLRTLVPSFNINRQPIGDAATVIRPANLRNLAPDHTLVLVNNKRRHRAAVISWLGNGVADGSQGADISPIPSIALRQVEVLRDGASAQYGSDAIAGVMNFMLKDSADGGSVEVRTGQYSEESDGSATTVALNFGLPLGDRGFANLSAEFGSSDPTSRSNQRPDAQGLIDAGNTNVRVPAQIWGAPEIDDDLKFFGNFGYLTEGGKTFYAHTNYATKTVTGGFFFRNPNTRSAVFSGDDGETLLIGDALDAAAFVATGADPADLAGCPTVRIGDWDNSGTVDGMEVANAPDPVALAAVFADPNCFSFQELFPGGFTPNFGGEVQDMSIVAGLKGQLGDSGGVWDASVSFGSSEADFFISNTVNASLGPNTPTTFDPGLYKQEDLNFNFDVSFPLNDRANLAAGVEYRDEDFTIGIGQGESWEIGPYAVQGFSAASNGFPGFSDIAAGNWNRANYAIYGDLELIGDQWTFGAALRFEDFDDFGTTTNGKLAYRYRFNDNFQARGSVSTGFRAPTPGQSNAFNVSTEFSIALQELTNNGTVPSTSGAAKLRGGLPLEPEESLNYTIGVVGENGPFTITADLFFIELSDRLGISKDFELTDAEVMQLEMEGITSASNLQNFRFFINDFDTETTGLDLVLTLSPAKWQGKTDFSLLFNTTDTEVTKFNTGLDPLDPADDTLDATRIRELQEALPETRWTLSANHRATDKLRFLGRVSYYDDWYDSEDVGETGPIYSGKTLVDLEAGYTFNDHLSFVLGGQNVLNETPDAALGDGVSLGRKYSQYSPFGFDGAYWYARLKYAWDKGI